MLGSFGGATKVKNINTRFTSLYLIGGVDCSSGLTPDLKVLGGAQIKKKLCVNGSAVFKNNITVRSALIHEDLTILGNLNVPTINGNVLCLNDGLYTDLIIPKQSSNIIIDSNVIVTGTLYANIQSVPITLSNAGSLIGNVSLVNNGVGPALSVKGLVAGSGITILDSSNDITISANTAINTTLTNAGLLIGNVSLVNDGVGPTLSVKGLVAGSGITILDSLNDITISANVGGGGIISVSGTTNQITSTGSPNVTLSIPTTWIAPGSIAATTTFSDGTTPNVTAGAFGSPFVLTTSYNVVISCPIFGAVRLPVPTPGMRVTIVNKSANSCIVFPHVGGVIDELGLNSGQFTGVRIPIHSSVTYEAQSITQWYTVSPVFVATPQVDVNYVGGLGNTSFGFECFKTLTTGTNNTAFGAGALKGITTESFLTAIGIETLSRTVADFNTGVGYRAGFNVGTGQRNTCVGHQALGNSVSSGSSADNVMIGHKAGQTCIGDLNVIIGANALTTNESTFLNTLVGANTSSSGINNVRNTLIGANTAAALNISEAVVLGNTQFGSGAINITGATGTGTLVTYTHALINPTTLVPGQKVNVTGITPGAWNILGATIVSSTTTSFTISSTVTSPAYTSGGLAVAGLTATRNGGFFVNLPTVAGGVAPMYIPASKEFVLPVSSERFKQNIRDLEDVTLKFNQIRPVRFNAKEEYGNVNVEHIGFIAEEINEQFPELIVYDQDGSILSLNYEKMTSIITKQLQTTRTELNNTKNDLNTLRSEFEAFKSQFLA